MSDFHRAFLELMERRGLNQADVVRLTGFSRGAVSMLYNGKREPNISSAIVLADALECSLDELAGRVPIK